jgi:hypothetical protein
MRSSNSKDGLRFLKKEKKIIFMEIKNVFSVEPKIFFVGYYFQSHETPKKTKITL